MQAGRLARHVDQDCLSGNQLKEKKPADMAGFLLEQEKLS
jgi:hypothetical protein